MNKFLKVAVMASKTGAKLLQKGFKKNIRLKVVDKKSGLVPDYVTKFDYQAQKEILRVITSHFPNHSLLSEEGIGIVKKSEYEWIIDPLDGTTNFSKGIPIFATTMALAKHGQILIGVTIFPIQNEIYWATHRHGAYMNGKKIKTSLTAKTRGAFVGLSMLRSKEALQLGISTFRKLMSVPVKPRIFGSVASDLARVAAGKLDAAVFNHTKPWDIAAGIILVREAGGKVSHLGTGKFSLYADQLVASNKHLHTPLIKLLK